MTNEIAKILARSLEPRQNSEIITHLCGLTKEVRQQKDGRVVRFPIPYDYDSANYQIDNSVLVPDQRYRSIVYFEGNDTSITGFEPKKSKASTSLRMVCWYDRSKFNKESSVPLHSGLISLFLSDLAQARPDIDSAIGGFKLDVNTIYDSVSSLFSRYTYVEERGQYLMAPYFAFGIDLTVTYQINHGCNADLFPIDVANCR